MLAEPPLLWTNATSFICVSVKVVNVTRGVAGMSCLSLLASIPFGRHGQVDRDEVRVKLLSFFESAVGPFSASPQTSDWGVNVQAGFKAAPWC